MTSGTSFSRFPYAPHAIMNLVFRAGLILTLALFLMGTTCGGDGGIVAPKEPGSIEVLNDGQTGTVAAALANPITVRLLDTEGEPLKRWALDWSVEVGGGSLASASTDTDSDGQAQNTWTLGEVAGTQEVSVVVSGGSVSATVTAVAEPGPATGVAVDPDSLYFDQFGVTQQLSATVEDEFGNALDDASISWSSSNTSVATVDDAGVVTSQGDGQATITASSGSASGTAVVVVERGLTVEISPATDTLDALGASTDLDATVTDADGNTITNPTIDWTSLSTSVAAVDAQGVVTAQGPGTALIVADYQGEAADTAEVVVRQVPAALAISPTSVTIRIDSTAGFKAVLRDGNAHPVVDAGYTWLSTNSTVVSVTSTSDSLATVTGQAEGSARVVVEAGGLSDTADVTVGAAAAVDSVAVTPALDTLDAGATTQLSLRAWDGGTEITDPAATWSTTASSVATVDAQGLVTGQAEGVARIAGTVGDASDTTTVAVLETTSLLSTAFFENAFEATAVAGATVAVPVRLDLSRVSSDGDLGSAQFELTYDAAEMKYDSAAVLSGGLTNEPSTGTIAYAFASTSPQGSGDVLLGTFYFTVDPALAVDEVIRITITYTAAPSDTDVNDYSMPVVLTGTLRVTP